MRAVIPAAGLGTRMLPATKNSPKEMLPVVDKPAIQYVVEECVASGIRDILIITGRGKRAIEDHFDHTYELERLLEAKGDTAQLEEMRRIADMADIHYVRQKETRGLGHAVLHARQYVGDEPFALLLGDDIIIGEPPCTRQLVDLYERHGRSIIAVEPIPSERIENYGVIAPAGELEPGLFAVRDLVEKPRRGEAPSDLGILGRYVLTPQIFDVLERTPPGRNGEIQLTDALRLLGEKQRILASRFRGRRYDIGTKHEWLRTNIEVALTRADAREQTWAYLEDVVKRGRPF